MASVVYGCLKLGSLDSEIVLGLSGRDGRKGRKESGSAIHEFRGMEMMLVSRLKQRTVFVLSLVADMSR